MAALPVGDGVELAPVADVAEVVLALVAVVVARCVEVLVRVALLRVVLRVMGTPVPAELAPVPMMVGLRVEVTPLRELFTAERMEAMDEETCAEDTDADTELIEADALDVAPPEMGNSPV